MNPYTVTRPVAAPFAALKQTNLSSPAALSLKIYLSPHKATDPRVTDTLDKQGKDWESFAPPPYPLRERSRDAPAKIPPGWPSTRQRK